MENSFYLELGILLFILILYIVFFVIFSKKKDIYKLSLVCIVLFLVILSILCLIHKEFTTPKIVLYGDKIIELKLGEKYKEPGYELKHTKKNQKISIKNNLDNKNIGIYNIEYSIMYHDKKIYKNRKIKVIDSIPPKIILKGNDNIEIVIGEEYKEPGYIIKDNYDNDLLDKIKITDNIKDIPGKYFVTYEVTDSSGNKSTIKRNIIRIEKSIGKIYLTFDDGPSNTTPQVLDILKKNNIKATFFIINYNSNTEQYIKRIVKEGHSLALHSYTHNYKLIYSSSNAYFDDLYKLKNKVKDTTGLDLDIIRFPGGSSNTVSYFNRGIMTRLSKEVREKGFKYFDWNVDSSDAWSARNSNDVYNNVMNGLRPRRDNIVLMHDFSNNNKTLGALNNIIRDAKNKGYSFHKITDSTKPVTHGINN